MPILDPRAGYAAIWIVSCFLFLSIAVGGGFLLMYMILPESDSTYWLPIAGVTLVCLPWLFWLCTCLYRIISRLSGFRMSIGGVGGGAGGGGGGGGSSRGRNIATSNHGAGNVNNNGDSSGRDNNDNNQNGIDNNGQERKEDSFRSRESEIPLTSSMVP